MAATGCWDPVTDTADTAPETQSVRGGFPQIKPAERVPPGLGRFVAAMRRLQDLTVSTKPDSSIWTTAAEHVENACALLDGHQVPAALAPAGRVIELPGLGHPLMPPWTVTDSGPDGVIMEGHFTRSHVGGNNAVHGGMIPLFYDWLFGMVVSTAGCPPTRTAFLHVDYRSITPIDEPLTAQGGITEIDGRKFFISATMTAADGKLLSEANGLMVRLLPHQP
jgi:acyl-coenzyme A thioesterase PaaI-like protein